MKLTKRTVDALPKPDKDKVYWDDGLTGFGIRVRAGGSKTFIVQYRNAQGKERKITVGRYVMVTADEEREQAKSVLPQRTLKSDTAAEREAQKKAITVEQLCRQYLADCENGLILGRAGKQKKASTVVTDRGRIERHIIPL